MSADVKPLILVCGAADAAAVSAAAIRFPRFTWRQVEPDAQLAAIAEAQIVYGRPKPEALAAAGQLKWVQSASAGVEQYTALAAFRAGGFTLTTASGMHASCVEHGIALLLGFTRRIGQHARLQQQQRWKSREQVPTPLVLDGKTLGILGLGAIGCAIARIVTAMGMRTIGVNFSGKKVAEVAECHPVADLDRVLPRCDALMLVLPATPATDRLLDAQRLALLPAHAVVVNIGRGNAIDEPALIAALKSGRLAGAALDVFSPEPLAPDSPLYDLPNLVMTPHIGGNRPDYDQQAFALFLDNLERFAAGKPLKNLVGRERGY